MARIDLDRSKLLGFDQIKSVPGAKIGSPDPKAPGAKIDGGPIDPKVPGAKIGVIDPKLRAPSVEHKGT